MASLHELEFVSHRGVIAPRLRDVSPGFSSNELMTLADLNHLENAGDRLHESIDGSFGKSKPAVVVEVEVENSRGCTETMTLAFVENKWHVMGSVDWLLNGPLFKA
ncbi:hypothetical protein PsorP6_002496 [Peronosclerospora sorghi]|uniref:Uncharacterized protein n=1 Tax=Peronosclerospora sorghi TaxID=230839 RepID=A0ACC0WSY5_9STRA|nr:hypothetical protein PsorP6_002496 [Peronosclerospora sorghi]